jgi:hypothetical protein
MLNSSNSGLRRFSIRQSHSGQKPNLPVLLPRFWMVLSVLALPFMALCADCFETLERSGTAGAVIADTLLPVTILGYFVLLYKLKQRSI